MHLSCTSILTSIPLSPERRTLNLHSKSGNLETPQWQLCLGPHGTQVGETGTGLRAVCSKAFALGEKAKFGSSTTLSDLSSMVSSAEGQTMIETPIQRQPFQGRKKSGFLLLFLQQSREGKKIATSLPYILPIGPYMPYIVLLYFPVCEMGT